jgi:hypothetical protein
MCRITFVPPWVFPSTMVKEVSDESSDERNSI